MAPVVISVLIHISDIHLVLTVTPLVVTMVRVSIRHAFVPQVILDSVASIAIHITMVHHVLEYQQYFLLYLLIYLILVVLI